MVIKKKLTSYTPTEAEQNVLDALGDYIDKDCWESFAHIHKQVTAQIDKLKKSGKHPETKSLKSRNKKLIYARINELKQNLKNYYEKELETQQVEFVCYYCEQSLREKRGKSLAEVDHILYKEKYPALTLLPFNLVPVCRTCNSTYKRTEDVLAPGEVEPNADNLSTLKYLIIHPYIDDKEDFFESGKGFVFQIKRTGSDELKEKARKTIELFGLNELNNIEQKINSSQKNDKDYYIDEQISLF